MNSHSFLFGILPLLVFVIVDSCLSLKAGVIAALVFAVLEAVYTYWSFGELDIVTIASFFLVLVLGFVSLKKGSPLFIKMQPVILSIALGAALLVSFFIKQPLLYVMMVKYQKIMPPQVQAKIADPLFIEIMIRSTFFAGIALFLHAGVTAWAAVKLSNWWWLFMRAAGFYFFLALAILASAKLRFPH